jgi:hypothetical protein
VGGAEAGGNGRIPFSGRDCQQVIENAAFNLQPLHLESHRPHVADCRTDRFFQRRGLPIEVDPRYTSNRDDRPVIE